jgi:Fibronectin type III-like domain
VNSRAASARRRLAANPGRSGHEPVRGGRPAHLLLRGRYPVFTLLDDATAAATIVGQLILMVCVLLYLGPWASAISELFPAATTVLGAHGGTCLPGLSTGLSNSSWRRRRGGATLSPRSRAIISQPVRRLRGFERVTLDPGQTRTVTFTLNKSDFGFYDNRGRFVVEPGEIDVYADNSSAADTKQSFTVGR